MKGISLFASAGIAELRLPRKFFDFVLANELLEERAAVYHFFYPQTEILCGDITCPEIKSKIIRTAIENDTKLLLATPPCQGVSTLGKNKVQSDYLKDRRNFLILEVFDIIDACNFDYILIENVPKFLDMFFPYNRNIYKIKDIIEDKYSYKYNIAIDVFNAKDYGVSQSRPRAIIRLWTKDKNWGDPPIESEIPLSESIGFLPSLEAGEDSGIPWHYAKKEVPRFVESMKHTPTGKSAIGNGIYHPTKANGSKIKGFHNTFKRMRWDAPCPARTTYSGSLTSHNNVHPGRPLSDGTYSDARVLTLLETFIVSSIPEYITFPKGTTDGFIRRLIGESIPPLLLYKILKQIMKS